MSYLLSALTSPTSHFATCTLMHVRDICFLNYFQVNKVKKKKKQNPLWLASTHKSLCAPCTKSSAPGDSLQGRTWVVVITILVLYHKTIGRRGRFLYIRLFIPLVQSHFLLPHFKELAFPSGLTKVNESGSSASIRNTQCTYHVCIREKKENVPKVNRY